MILKKFFIFSLVIHFILLSFQQWGKIIPNPKIVHKLQIKTRIHKNIKKKQGTRKTLSKSSTSLFSKLSVVRQNKNFETGAKVSNIDFPMTSSEGNIIYSKINEVLTYPNQLSILGVQGHILVDAYFDKKGYFHEDKSKFNFSNKLLSIHVRQTLRRAFLNNIRLNNFRHGYYKLNFVFQITTTPNTTRIDPNSTSNIDFLRINYGVVTRMDRVNHSINKILLGATNIFSLLEYLPKNQDEEKSRILLFLDQLKNDKKW